VNLIGYAVGVGGVTGIIQRLFTPDGLHVLLWSIYFSAVGTSIFMYVDNYRLQQVRIEKEVEMKSRRE
jgi:uncharacterized membrane protein (DUF2068 family)